MSSIPLALYVHMPWCVRKCPYCDFNSHQLKSAQPDASYIDALLLDLDGEVPRVQGRQIESVFFGGGTPSLFPPAEFARFLKALRARLPLAKDAEITLEANPGTIERGAFAGYADSGINRVSLGAQSFDAAALTALGRIHSPEDTQRAVAELRAAGIANFNLDLMYALPQQSLQSARRDVLTAIELQPTHISYYQLTLEPGTVFHSRPPPLPDEDAAWDIQLMGQGLLQAAGFAQYEVSAYARPGARCRHNLNYWLFGDYLGIGAGAHGKLTLQTPEHILRTLKPKQPRDYQERIQLGQAFREESSVPPAQLSFEFMLNALRLNEGFSAGLFEERTGLTLESVQPRLQAAQQAGLLEPSGAGWRPTTLGRRFLNDLQATFLD
jgi:putative oxygen-independent coproporphyrinogen III oxidase